MLMFAMEGGEVNFIVCYQEITRNTDTTPFNAFNYEGKDMFTMYA